MTGPAIPMIQDSEGRIPAYISSMRRTGHPDEIASLILTLASAGGASAMVQSSCRMVEDWPTDRVCFKLGNVHLDQIFGNIVESGSEWAFLSEREIKSNSMLRRFSFPP